MKILYVTTIGKTMRFFETFLKEMVGDGHVVELAANAVNSPIPDSYKELGCKFHQIDFSRSPLSPDNIKAFGQLKEVISKGNYDIVHCHTPNASVITRLVCRKLRKNNDLKVFYTAHGFHFFKGAPKLNWMLYYPVEKFCARFTDKLITINKEDFDLAKGRIKAKEIHYVPGVGINLSRFKNVQVNRNEKRHEIGVPDEAFLLLSVGELNDNKNHHIIIKALALLSNPNVHYAIAGMGEKKDYLLELAQELGVSDQLHLLGYRKDIPELNYSADVFCFPSKREGLGVAAIEAMACGLPLITSNVHGINDYSIDGVTGYKCSPYSAEEFSIAIKKLIDDVSLKSNIGLNNAKSVSKYDISTINPMLKRIYGIELPED